MIRGMKVFSFANQVWSKQLLLDRMLTDPHYLDAKTIDMPTMARIIADHTPFHFQDILWIVQIIYKLIYHALKDRKKVHIKDVAQFSIGIRPMKKVTTSQAFLQNIGVIPKDTAIKEEVRIIEPRYYIRCNVRKTLQREMRDIPITEEVLHAHNLSRQESHEEDEKNSDLS